MNAKQAGIRPTVKILKNLIRFGSFLGFFPYKWDAKNQRVYQRSAKWKWVYQLWTLAIAAYWLFLVYGCYVTLKDPETSSLVKARSVYMTTMLSILTASFRLNSDENQLVINQIFYYTLHFKAKFGTNLSPGKLNLTARLILFTYVFGCSNSLAVLRTPESKRLLTSLLPNPKEAPLWLTAFFMLVHFLLYACQFFYIGFNLLVLFCYECLVTPVLERLRWSNRTTHWTTKRTTFETKQDAKNLTPEIVYRHSLSLLVLQSAFQSAYGPWVLTLTTWGVVMITLNVFQSVVFWHLRSLVAGTVLALLVRNITKFSAEVFKKAVQVRQSWVDARSPLWFAKHVESWRPARVPLGAFFYFDKGLWLTIMNIILVNSANLIVSYRD